MFVRFTLVAALLLASASQVHALEQPRRLWLDCAAPKDWPASASMPWRLSCRLQMPSGGPAFWATVNPFAEETFQLIDPFSVEATAQYIDVFERGRYARARRGAAIPRLVDPFADPGPIRLIDPFSDDLDQVIDPFAPYQRKKRP